MHRLESSNYSFGCVRTAGDIVLCSLKVLQLALKVVCVLLFPVAHSVIGAFGAVGCLCMASYHCVFTYYHWRHTRERDSNGNLIPETEVMRSAGSRKKPSKNYKKEDGTFESKDLVRLQNEVDRLYHLKKLDICLREARTFAKCIIPLFGPAWVEATETGYRTCCTHARSDCRDDIEWK